MTMPLSSPLDAALAVIALWIVVGVTGLFETGRARFINKALFPAGAVLGFVLAGIGAYSIGGSALTRVLPLGLPDLPFHLRLDPLSSFFLFLLGVGAFGISVYACGYFRDETLPRLRLLCLQYHVFLASMAAVILADDAYLFMVVWETMALSSYFLVTTDHKLPAIRSAGYLYLLIAQSDFDRTTRLLAASGAAVAPRRRPLRGSASFRPAARDAGAQLSKEPS